MRLSRLFSLVLAVATAGLLLAPAAAAQPPFRLTDYVTDDAGALTGTARGDVQSALDQLYTDQHVRLWVVYLDTFSGQAPVSWAQSTRRASDLDGSDALLAVAVTDRSYAFLVPQSIKSVNAHQVDDLRVNMIEPALHRGDWGDAAIKAADGLDQKPNAVSWTPMLIGLAVIGAAVLALLWVMRRRRARRRAAALAAARQVDPADPDALAGLSTEALDDLSRALVVEVDNAVRTSANELSLAVEEFGAKRTEPFSRAVEAAKAALRQAFTVRQQLDDAIPETPEQRRELLTRVIVAAGRADHELESQTHAFEQLRDLVINAPSRLDGLTQQVVELTAKIAPAEQRLAELTKDFAASALASIAGNVAAAQERIAFADQNIGRAREVAARALAGQQSALVDAVRTAESALGQARALLDAVDSAADDIRHAAGELASVIAHVQEGVRQADSRLRQTASPHVRDLTAARNAAAKAVDVAGRTGSADPLGAFTALTAAGADLDKLVSTVAEEQADAERLNRTLEQALFTADSRVRAASDFIDTRRGSIGPEARTRLTEAGRHLQAARAERSADVNDAIAHANAAARLAVDAQSLADDDVRSVRQAYAGGGGGHMGAMMGGIILGDLLGGGMGGGWGGGWGGGGGWGDGGGWSPASYGGSSGGSDGGFMGGGGRF
jgi:predicted  nucleic acid-binding Zn-ribbon protein